MPALKKWNVGSVEILGSRGFYQKPQKEVEDECCVMLNVAGVASRYSNVWLCVFFLSGHRRNLVFYSSPFFKSDQLWSFVIFYREGHRVVEKLLLILFFAINSIKISPCAESMRRDTFFSFWKKSWSWQHLVSASCPVNWNCHYFVCTINQKRSLPII